MATLARALVCTIMGTEWKRGTPEEFRVVSLFMNMVSQSSNGAPWPLGGNVAQEKNLFSPNYSKRTFYLLALTFRNNNKNLIFFYPEDDVFQALLFAGLLLRKVCVRKIRFYFPK